MMRILNFLLAAAVAVISVRCSAPDESTPPLHATGLSTPVVTGLRITNAYGPQQVAVWGVPSDPAPNGTWGSGRVAAMDTVEPIGTIPALYEFGLPYPNPSDGSMDMGFALPKSSVVSMWVVRARWVGSPNTDPISFYGITVNAPNTTAVRTLMYRERLPAGHFRVEWNGQGDNNIPVSAGFYRVYFQASDFSSWHDVFLFRSWDDLPGGLRELVIHR